MAPSYKQNTAKIGEIHGTVNLRFKRPVHEGYIYSKEAPQNFSCLYRLQRTLW